MNKELSYDLHAAINMNGGEPYGWDHNTGNPIIGDVKQNYLLAADASYLWGHDWEDWYQVLPTHELRNMAKKEFKDACSSMRRWYREQAGEKGIYGHNI